jgi:hypothetical protein
MRQSLRLFLGGQALVFAACATSSQSPGGSADAGSIVDTVVNDAHVGDATVKDAPAADAASDVLDAGASETATDASGEAAPYVDPFGGASGCPDGGFMSARPDCNLVMPVSGGVSTVAGDYCRNSASTSWIWYATNGINPDVQINFAQPIVRGVVGSHLAASVSLLYQPTSGTWVTWTTASGTCTVNLDSNVCWFYSGAAYYLISGRGTCSAPATPQPANAGTPVTIGDFSFSYSIYP